MQTQIAVKPAEKAERPLSYRFRKAWRAVLFAFLVPFLRPDLITSVVPQASPYIIQFTSGVLVLIPLSTFIEVVTEDLIERLGQLVGGLLHALFSNIAFFAITTTTLIKAAQLLAESQTTVIDADHTELLNQANDLVSVVQSSIAGTIVIDLLFILGVAIFVGGMRNGRMQFSAEYSNQYAEMITVAIIALALPSLANKLGVAVGFNSARETINVTESTTLSDITAVILIVAYIGYIGWTIFKFRDMPAKPQNPEEATASLRGDLYGVLAEEIAPIEEKQQREQLAAASTPTMKKEDTVTNRDASAVVQIANERIAQARKDRDQEKKAESRGIAVWELAILVAGTAGVVFVSENMARALENGFLKPDSAGSYPLGLNPFFIGFIVLPVASNLVELSAAVSAAWHDRMETCLAITAGSAIQVALLVAPALVLVGHLSGLTTMNLIFGLFILAIFALIAYLFQLITVDGETSWLEGLQFSSFFAVITAIAYFAHP